jgi:hypothetical protein
MKIYQIIILASFAFFACEKSTESLSPMYEAGIAFNLEYDETTNCNGCDGPELRFVNVVTESRCPEPVACLWAGEVIVELEIDGEIVLMGLSPIETAPAEVTVGEWNITLLNVFPYPTEFLEEDQIDPSIYSLELRVEMM